MIAATLINKDGQEVGRIAWNGITLETSGMGDKLRWMAVRKDPEQYIRGLEASFNGDPIRAEVQDGNST